MIALGVVASVMMLRATNLLWMLLPNAICTIPLATDDGAGSGVRIFCCGRRSTCVSVSSIALALALSLTGAYLIKHTWWDTEDVNALKEAMDSKAGFEGTDEYDPLGDDHTDVPQHS